MFDTSNPLYKIKCHDCKHDVFEHAETKKPQDEQNSPQDYITINGTNIYVNKAYDYSCQFCCISCSCENTQVQILLHALERFLGLLGCTE